MWSPGKEEAEVRCLTVSEGDLPKEPLPSAAPCQQSLERVENAEVGIVNRVFV